MKQFNNKSPLVSVIMPVYNAGEFLRPAIESIVKQTFKDFEFIIVDDGSTDKSWRIIESYRKRYSELINAYKLKKNTNAAGNGAMNNVLPKARGEYIARMDADDIAHSERLEKQVKFLDENRRVILLGTQARVIDGKGNVTGKKSNPLDNRSIYKKYALVHPIIHPSCMIRRSMLPDRNKLYELRFGVNDDYYTFFKLQRYGEFANLPEYLLDYRIHSKNSSLSNLKERYLTISEIRRVVQIRFGYEISLPVKLTVFLQDLFVRVLPEDKLVLLYLFLRGFNHHPRKSKLSFAYEKIQEYALSLF